MVRCNISGVWRREQGRGALTAGYASASPRLGARVGLEVERIERWPDAEGDAGCRGTLTKHNKPVSRRPAAASLAALGRFGVAALVGLTSIPLSRAFPNRRTTLRSHAPGS